MFEFKILKCQQKTHEQAYENLMLQLHTLTTKSYYIS